MTDHDSHVPTFNRLAVVSRSHGVNSKVAVLIAWSSQVMVVAFASERAWQRVAVSFGVNGMRRMGGFMDPLGFDIRSGLHETVSYGASFVGDTTSTGVCIVGERDLVRAVITPDDRWFRPYVQDLLYATFDQS